MAQRPDWEFPRDTIIPFTLHTELGFPKFDNPADIHKYSVVSNDEYRTAPKNLEKTIVYKDTPIQTRGRFISKVSITKIKTKYPQEDWRQVEKYQIPIIEDVEKHVLLPTTAEDLIKVYKQLCSVNTDLSFINPPKEAVFWLSLFCWYGEYFCACYDEYMNNPDDCVGEIDDIQLYVSEKHKTSPRSVALTIADIRSSCHLILVSMNKTFAISPSERDKQLRQYITNRKSAVYASMGSPIGELAFNDNFLLEIHDNFRMMPKLRKALFMFMVTNKSYPEFSTAGVLLIHSSMTTIKAMLDFIQLDKKTLAHCEPLMLEEIHKFMLVINRKKNEDGGLWPYHRIIHPDDGDLNAANFPNLAVGSIHYQKRFGEASFQFMVAPNFPTLPGLIEKSTTYDDRPIYKTDKKTELSDDATQGALILGLDIAKLEGTKGFQKKINAQEASEEDINKLARRLQGILDKT